MAEEEARRPVSRIQITRTAEIQLALDDEKIEAIKNCLAKGTLTIRNARRRLDQSRTDRRRVSLRLSRAIDGSGRRAPRGSLMPYLNLQGGDPVAVGLANGPNRSPVP